MSGVRTWRRAWLAMAALSVLSCASRFSLDETGDAAASSTCELACGQQGPVPGKPTCFCDDECSNRGDCCGDYVTYCSVGGAGSGGTGGGAGESGGMGGVVQTGGTGGVVQTGGTGGVVQTGGTSGTGSVAGSGGAAGGGGTGGGSGEICDNGKDDDGDKLVDCADSECTTHACVPAAPTNWVGPVWFYQGPSGNPQPSCQGGVSPAVAGSAGLKPGSIDCGCKCGKPSGGSCAIGQARARDDGDCIGSAGTKMFTPVNNKCTNPPLINGDPPWSVVPATLSVQGGKCTPSGTKTTPTPPSFGSAARACGVKLGAGCTGSKQCWPKPKTGFGAKACVFRTGSQICPSPFTQKNLVYDGFNDGRQCTCKCGNATGQACTGDFSVFSDDACTLPKAGNPWSLSLACIAIQPALRGIKYNVTGVQGGSCNPSEQVAGQVSGTSPTTICCLP